MGGFNALLRPSEALAKVTGPDPLTRPQVMKKLWVYIKAKNLQNPDNKRNILSDEVLLPIFDNKPEVTMFEMAKLVGPHLTKED